MRSGRKLFLLFALALTAMALTTSTASAQEEPVEAQNEASGVHCNGEPAPPATSNCRHHIVGSRSLTLHQFGAESQISACEDEFVATLGEAGNGAYHTYENDAASSATCTRVMCNGIGEPATETEWPITQTGEYTGSQTEEGHFTYRFCLDDEANPDGAGTHCTMEIDIHNHGNHHYGFEADNEECPIVGMLVWVEINGDWESEATPDPSEDDVEIIH